MGRIVAGRATVQPVTITSDPAPPTPNELLRTIGAYIPTDVTSAYVPVAAGMTAAAASASTRFWVAIGASVLAAFTTWVIGHRHAKTKTPVGQDPPNWSQTLRAGWYEIPTAGIALFAWATAMPGGWHDWGKSVLYVPAAIVVVTSLVLGGVAALLNRPGT
jgi:hypothetical protein